MGNKELTKTEKKYSKKEIFTLKSVFDDADVDQSGEIDVAELRKALNKSNLGRPRTTCSAPSTRTEARRSASTST